MHDIDFSALTPDPALAARIADLPGRRIIFTNADTLYACKVLERRGLSGLFDAIYGVEDTGYLPKPGRDAFERIIATDGLAPERFGFLRVARRVATVLAVVLLWYWFRGDRIRSFRSLGATREGWQTGVAWRYAIGGALTVGLLVACEGALGVRVLDLEVPRWGPWLRAVEILVGAAAVALLEELVFRGALLFPVMDMMGRAFGELKFGLASAYGFMLTLAIVAVTALMYLLRSRKEAK